MDVDGLPDDLEEGPPRVVIADRHGGMLRALESLIVLTGAGVVVGTACELASAGQLARRHRADVVLADADLLADEQHALGPLSSAVKIVATGMERHHSAASAATRRGASAWIVKDQAHTDLPALLRAVRPSAATRRRGHG